MNQMNKNNLQREIAIYIEYSEFTYRSLWSRGHIFLGHFHWHTKSASDKYVKPIFTTHFTTMANKQYFHRRFILFHRV